MRVYIITEGPYADFGAIKGVFLTRKGAELWLKQWLNIGAKKPNRSHYGPECRPYQINEWTIDQRE